MGSSTEELASLKGVEDKLDRLQRLARRGVKIDETAHRALLAEYDQVTEQIFAMLDPMGAVAIARHPKRPHTMDFISLVFSRFMELHGDRSTSDDAAIVGGMAYLDQQSVMVIGHDKGRTLAEHQLRNWGRSGPGGYRKARRLMETAAKFRRPIICFIDTLAAQADAAAEAGGISAAIAQNLQAMFGLPVPIIAIVIGEGGSGGAIGIGVGDRVLMLQYAVYSVIPPEACAGLIWRDEKKAAEAADALKLTASDALRLGVVDEVLPEPLGSAYRDPATAAQTLKAALIRHIDELQAKPVKQLLEERHRRFRNIGQFVEATVSEESESL